MQIVLWSVFVAVVGTILVTLSVVVYLACSPRVKDRGRDFYSRM